MSDTWNEDPIPLKNPFETTPTEEDLGLGTQDGGLVSVDENAPANDVESEAYGGNSDSGLDSYVEDPIQLKPFPGEATESDDTWF